ncbi:MAG: hypothetical protein KDC85_15525 [Saprospiraceae bacterium]|nr:hypothetical protein [Saprospiraceae bacterium]MCB9325852.1 hypothetical protein [Lewinellaceae bacterium]
MRFATALIITMVFAFILHQFLPWWAIVLAGFLSGLIIKSKPFEIFLAAFLGGLFLWGGMSLWINSGNEGILAARIGQLFGGIGATGILAFTALFGGMFAGLGGLTGRLLIRFISALKAEKV